MFSDIIQAAYDAQLSPIVSRIAVIIADIAGKNRALRFIDSCKHEGEARGINLLEMDTVPQ